MPSPKLLKGAIVHFSQGLVTQTPNLLVFQYNPDGITRSLAPPTENKRDLIASSRAESLYTEPYDPDEDIDLTLFIDATDGLESDSTIARATGIADRVSALEMLAYPRVFAETLAPPVGQTLAPGGPPGLTPPSLPAANEQLMVATKVRLPIALFVWGPGRIVPIRVKSVRVEEQQWNQLLYPTRTKVTLGMVVLTPAALGLEVQDRPKTPGTDLALTAYEITFEQKAALAALGLLDTAASSSVVAPILRALPIPVI